MATFTMPRAGTSSTIRFEYGVPEIVALKFLSGKNVEGKFGPQVLFTCEDDRRFYVELEDGSDIERALRDLGIQRGELISLTKIKLARGGGHAFRVERAAPAAPADDVPAWVRDAGTAPASRQPAPTREESLLEKSVAIARTHGAQAFQRNAHVMPAAAEEAAPAPAPRPDDTTRRLMSCFAASIDAISEAQAFADRKGLKVTFTSEDVRATAITAFIQAEKAAMGMRY